MKMCKMLRVVVSLGASLLVGSVVMPGNASAQVLISYWNFNNDSVLYNSPASGDVGSFSTTAASYGEQYNSGTSRLYSNTANGTIYNGSSVYIDMSNLVGTPNGGFNSATAINGWGVYVDSTLNRASTDSTTGGSFLVKSNGTGQNNSFIILSLSSLGYQSLSLSYDVRLNAGTGGAITWSYSTDGSSFTNISTPATTVGSFVSSSVSLPSLLNNQGNFYLKLTYTFAGGSTTFDNIQLTGTAVPEPGSVALLGVGLGALLLMARGKLRKA